MRHLDEFLKLAPAPWPLEAGRKWHIFLSYRSTERKWVLALYDILTQLKYRAFMDQFVLVAGEGLASSLGENLDVSDAGILVWSTQSGESAWCKKEYNTFQTLEAGGKFRFATLRLPSADLPGFVKGTLWIDCAEQRDGPSGDSLLRLLFGLHGKPLPPEAVRLATEIDEASKKDMAAIRVQAGSNDSASILALVEKRKDHLAWQFSPALYCAAAQALISIGAATKALSLLDTVRAVFPAAIRPRQLTGLALARSGSWKEAKAVLGELYELGERDPETVAMYARTWMDAYRATGDRLLLRRSRDLYAECFESAPDNYYAGINAAAKSIFLDELDAGTELAKRVQAIVGTDPKPGDYWHTATVAEALLISRNFDLAATRYEEAMTMAPGAADDHRSTCKQARYLLKHLDATPEQHARVMGVFQRQVRCSDSKSVVEYIRSVRPRVVTFVGFSGTGYQDQEALHEAIRAELDLLSPHSTLICAGGTRDGIGAVYAIATQRGFRTAGIVSSQALSQRTMFSTECEVVLVVEDASWGGRQSNGRLSATSQAMVDACDVMIGIGGGSIARDELEAAQRQGKYVKFHRAEMDHQLAREKAGNDGEELKSFAGEADVLFPR